MEDYKKKLIATIGEIKDEQVLIYLCRLLSIILEADE